MKKALISDCEGPITKNDNAFEVTSRFVPNGNKLFTVISRYDDVLAGVIKKPGYKAGNTLKLILPFLKAHDLKDQKIEEFSAHSLILIPNVKDTLQHVRNIAHAFIVSTSYEHYIKALCQAIDFPCQNTYSTKVSIDKYNITKKEKKRLKELAKEISQMPIIEIPSEAKFLSDLSEEYQRTIKRLDEIFWNEVADMEVGRIFQEVNPVGGEEKAKAVKDAAEQASINLSNVMYIGDSITDMEAFKLVKENSGLAVSFNGNQYAIKSAEIAVLSGNSIVAAIITDVFCRFGKQETLSLVEKWGGKELKKGYVSQPLIDNVFRLYPRELPKVEIITSKNRENLAKESSTFRKQVRGEAIGRLG